MRGLLVCSLAVLACVQLQAEAKREPNYLKEGKTGAGVTKTAIRKLDEMRKGIFTNDKNMAFQWAKIISKFGKNGDVYKGGIWQLTYKQFRSIKASRETKVRKSIRRLKRRYDINFREFEYKDLARPLYGLIAARLLLYTERQKKGIPRKIEKQAIIFVEYVQPNLVVHDFTLKRGGIYKRKKVGPFVSKQAAKVVQEAKFFKDDYGFLANIAKVMTWYGKAEGTFAKGQFGGIWNVTEANFLKTKDTDTYPKLVPKLKGIRRTFGVPWELVLYRHLRIPFYSALAARLLIETFKGKIPEDVWGQAIYWRKHYAADGRKKDFYDLVTNNRGGPNICQPAIGTDEGDKRMFCYDLYGSDGMQYALIQDDSVSYIEAYATLKAIDDDHVHTKVASEFSFSQATVGVRIVVNYNELSFGDQIVSLDNAFVNTWDDGKGHTLSLRVKKGRVTIISNGGKAEIVIRRNTNRNVLHFRVKEFEQDMTHVGGIMGKVAEVSTVSSTGSENYFGTFSRDGFKDMNLLKKPRDYRFEHHVYSYDIFGDIFNYYSQ